MNFPNGKPHIKEFKCKWRRFPFGVPTGNYDIFFVF